MAKAKSSTTKIGNTKVVGATDADKQAIRAAKASVKAEKERGLDNATARAEARKTGKSAAIKRGDETPEAKRTTAEKSAAAKKMFKDADEAALVGLPSDMTHEQNENRVRRAALGY